MAFDEGVAVRESDLPWVDIQVRPGYKQRYQGFFDKSGSIGARIGSLYAEPYYHSPRHRHTFQQVRFIVSGKVKYGHETYFPGDCLYLPEGIPYGPVKPVQEEGSDQLHFVDIQFMGPSGIPYPHPDKVVAAQRALALKGSFSEGIYEAADGRKRDAYEAILEEVTGAVVDYPPGRLHNYVVMRSDAYPVVPHPTLPGVGQKHLGYFFECGPNLKMVSLELGAEIPPHRPDGHRAIFLLSGEIEFEGKLFDSLSYFVIPSATPCSAITARQATTMLVLGWVLPGSVLPFELF